MNKLLMKWALDDALRLHAWGRYEEAHRLLIKVIRRVVPEIENG